MPSGPASGSAALLPPGLRDLLPPDAAHAADTIERLRRVFASCGYDWVEPPLIEFEDTLLAGAGAATAGDTFRLMDPASQRMMGIRADITVQVARIATTRLANLPRPLRLAYAGPVLRVKGKQLRAERQFVQIGCELIGADQDDADAEAVVTAVDGLSALGVDRLTVDLTLPALVPSVLAGLAPEPRVMQRLRAALDGKDAATVEAIAAGLGPRGAVLPALLRAAGPADAALRQLAALDLPEKAAGEAARLAAVARLVQAALPALTLTVDPVENRGFEYESGLCFTIFRAGWRSELGMGGRYVATRAEDGTAEPATGFTLYLDPILRNLPEPKPAPRLFLPAGTPRATAQRLRAEGWRCVAGLSAGEADAEARRLGCTHVWRDGAAIALA
jgi:ATP phosphoribosyltransferase regulatory subunit